MTESGKEIWGIKTTTQSLIIEPLSRKRTLDKYLVIERKTCKMTEKNLDIVKKEGYTPYNNIRVFAILGIIGILGETFLVVVTNRLPIGSLDFCEIYEVQEVEFMPIKELEYTFLAPDVKHYIESIKKLMKDNFYFSYHYDLTSSKQRTSKFTQNTSNTSTHSHADNRYIWNHFLFLTFSTQKISTLWLTPVIQGYIGIKKFVIEGTAVQLSVIGRRQHAKAGTRFNARGMDDTGAVANYVETEQLLYIGEMCSSMLIVRGSVPAFWKQSSMGDKVHLLRSVPISYPVFKSHVYALCKDYDNVQILNLLTQGKGNEEVLTHMMKECVQLFHQELSSKGGVLKLKYTQFDYNRLCKGDNYDALKSFLNAPEREELLEWFGTYTENIKTKKKISQQKGVFRVNCLDCLDRTNVVQTKIAWKAFKNQLTAFGINSMALLGGEDYQGKASRTSGQHPLIQAFKNMWADHGDMLSMHYSGTGSYTSTVTRGGKKGIMGLFTQGVRSVGRYLQQWDDNLKQSCIDILLGKNPKNTPTPIIRHIKKQLKEQECVFTQTREINFCIGSWNVAGVAPTEKQDLRDWLLPYPETPDIYIIGLQEYVPLNVKNATHGPNEERIREWETYILDCLSARGSEFQVFASCSMVGLYIGVFAKQSFAGVISHIQHCKVKRGIKGMVGNKGGVLLRFTIKDTALCFINCHLESGQKKTPERFTMLREIVEIGQNKLGVRDNDNDCLFVFGDLNFRINLDNLLTRDRLESGNLAELLPFDQYLQNYASDVFCRHCLEGSITFYPTYKYDLWSNVFDSSKKFRIPGWCDRVLWRESKFVKFVAYGSAQNIMLSDHRPVFALFSVTIKIINKELKEATMDEIYAHMQTPRPSRPSPQVNMKTNIDNLTEVQNPSTFKISNSSSGERSEGNQGANNSFQLINLDDQEEIKTSTESTISQSTQLFPEADKPNLLISDYYPNPGNGELIRPRSERECEESSVIVTSGGGLIDLSFEGDTKVQAIPTPPEEAIAVATTEQPRVKFMDPPHNPQNPPTLKYDQISSYFQTPSRGFVHNPVFPGAFSLIGTRPMGPGPAFPFIHNPQTIPNRPIINQAIYGDRGSESKHSQQYISKPVGAPPQISTDSTTPAPIGDGVRVNNGVNVVNNVRKEEEDPHGIFEFAVDNSAPHSQHPLPSIQPNFAYFPQHPIP